MRDPARLGGTWLMDRIEEKRKKDHSQASVLTLPLTTEGKEYNVYDAEGDQLDILCEVLSKLKEWLNYTLHPEKHKRPFQQMRLTICGASGTGKSHLIKTIVTAIRKIFRFDDAVHVSAPTGAAAFNVVGQTIHRLFGVHPLFPSKNPSAAKIEDLKKMFKRTVALIMDERSMITCSLLGAAERNAAECAHNGAHTDEEWGGIPIVILVGDDYQLPPVTNRTEQGPFDIMDEKANLSHAKMNVKSSGAYQFLQLSTHVMTLTCSKRQHADQDIFKSLLDKLRFGILEEINAHILMKLKLENIKSEKTKEDIKKDAMYLYANKEPMYEHNYNMLSKQCSQDNPVALLKPKFTSLTSKKQATMKHFSEESTPQATIFCRGAIVCLNSKNFEPGWGLYNGAIGKVDESVFEDGKSPNAGDFPLYIAVDFPQYTGPTWDENNPTVSNDDL